jgi:1-acyl-sn-glycerol-3-phosphate acyltransferase
VPYIRTFYGFAYLILALIILAVPGCILALVCLTPLKKNAVFMMYKIAQAWALGLLAMTRIHPRVSGRESIIRRGGMCFVANHSGIFDIILLLAYAGRPFGFIAKKELSYIPFLNIWILLLGGHFIDRKSPRKAMKTINKGIEHIRKGGSMLIFPEGTRSLGRGLLPFRQGAFKLALESAMPIVPVAITGSYEVFEKHKLFIRCPVSISFGTIIAVGDAEDSKRRLASDTRSAIETMLRSATGAFHPALLNR